MLPTMKIARGNVDNPDLRNHHHLLHVSLLAMTARSPLLFANKKKIFSKKKEKLKVTVETWESKGAENFDSRNKKPPSKRSYVIPLGIPFGTLQHYINDDLSKRYKLGVSVGRKSYLNTRGDHFVASVIIRFGRGDNGVDQKDTIDLITDVVLTLSVKQAKNVLDRTLKNKHAGIDLKKHMVQAQKTTTNRSEITIK